MSIAATLQDHLLRKHITFTVVAHPPTQASILTAEVCHIPADSVAKGVVVRTNDRYVLAVLPASRRIGRAGLKAELGENFTLASESELAQLFEDCARGAIPPIGECYGLDTVVDDSIDEQPEVYLEGGDHATLVHMSHAQFASLTATARHGRFSVHG